MVETTRRSGPADAPPADRPAHNGAPGRAAPPMPRSPARPRRRPAVIGAGVALVALGGLTSGWLVTAAGDTVPVVYAARDVPRGERLQAADLAVVDVRPDTVLETVPAAQMQRLVGTTAAQGLIAGSLLTPASTTDEVVPAAGDALVGVALTSSQRPAEALVAGDAVRIVDTPPAQADPPVTEPDAIDGEVVSVTEPDPSGVVTVDVLVPAERAAALAGRAATGRVALVLDARGR